MRPQVIKFKNGQASTLRGGLVDLAKFGKIAVRRSSEILFDEPEQKYFIHFLDDEIQHMNDSLRMVLFDTYEDAVDHEVLTINKARKEGILTT